MFLTTNFSDNVKYLKELSDPVFEEPTDAKNKGLRADIEDKIKYLEQKFNNKYGELEKDYKGNCKLKGSDPYLIRKKFHWKR
jgi:hypothetical protein